MITSQIDSKKLLWVRSDKGIIFGVCEGLAPIFGLDVVLLRIIWIFASLTFGAGVLVYLILAVSL
ncbi:MAG: PspC domain-containing protein, partial [Bdellovibrionales bacterium]|nr:PspC domain-containing protein [Bdellovibrionales bacterium]